MSGKSGIFAPLFKNSGLWCNGNTTDSGPVVPGSNPGSPTQSFSSLREAFLYLHLIIIRKADGGNLFVDLQEYNPNFKPLEFEGFKKEAGLNAFTLSPTKWISTTNAIGIISKSGRYGGTYAHKDIAFKFASWISVEFELYIVKEFQRLKSEEQRQLGWSAKRELSKINYRIHTDAIKQNLIPAEVTSAQASIIYANEADVLNVAMFGVTAKMWHEQHPELKGNIRDYATINELICLSNMENLNALFIEQGMSQGERLVKLNQIAIHQMGILENNDNERKLLK